MRRKSLLSGLVVLVSAVLVCLLDLALAAAVAGAAGIDCRPFAQPCLIPFPNDLYTKKDPGTVTGRRVHLPQNAMPLGSAGRLDVTPYNRADGFDPGSTIIARVPGLDTAKALAKTNPVRLRDISRYRARRAPVVVLDAKTGKRAPIWVELDSTSPTKPTNETALLIHPAKLLSEGHRYIVALRFLKDARGHTLAAPRWFRLLRDGKRLPPAERAQRRRYSSIFRVLARAGIARKSLYMAWDFTVESRRSLTGPMLAIRNDAFAQLGDTNLADGVPQGSAPSFTVTGVTSSGLPTGIAREIEGTFQVPCYLTTTNCTLGGVFNYGPGAYPVPVQNGTTTAHFQCIIPSSASAGDPARALLYGHGLFGTDEEATDGAGGSTAELAAQHNFMSCGTEWWGLAGDSSGAPGTENDLLYAGANVAHDLSKFPTLGDRLQQAMLNALFLARLMRSPDGFASDANFQDADGQPLFSSDHVYYYGNSQGGIMGGSTVAISPDIRRGVLGVPGLDYGGLLLQRSSDFVPAFSAEIQSSYSDVSTYTLLLDLVGQLWARAEADGYALHMTSDPLPGTPAHKVLLHVAYGDHQVTMYAAAVEARTIGAHAYEPGGSALDLPQRARDKNLLWGVPAIKSLPFAGSGIVIWDAGPGQVDPPPFANLPPSSGQDPHSYPRETIAAQTQISDFLDDAMGAVTDVCSNAPCHTDNYAP